MLKIAVCDDDPRFLREAESRIREWAKERKLDAEVTAFDNGDALLKKCLPDRPDVIFLDIVMPLLNGMDTARELRLRDTAVRIVFLTSSPEFALESYEVKAKGYLLKPVDPEKLYGLLDECAAEADREPEHIVMRTPFGYRKLYLHEIEYAEALNKRVVFYLRSGRTEESTETFYAIEEKLSKNRGFFKCHRSYLVYLPNVDHFNTAQAITLSGRSVPIARGSAKPFKDAYFAMMFPD